LENQLQKGFYVFHIYASWLYICCSLCLCRIVHFLRDNVAAGCHRWKNNGCESLNHVLKQCVQWRPNKLPDLIEKIQNVVDAQYVDADRALLGYGNFVLRPQYARHRHTLQDWGRMTACQRARQWKFASGCQRAAMLSLRRTAG